MKEPVTETATVTILFTDVVGSTSLRQRHGEKAAHVIMSAHEGIIREQLGTHAGQEIKTIGDSFMIAFDSARKAVEPRSFPSWAVSRSTISIRISWRTFIISPVTAWTPSLTPSVAPISGNPARRSVLAEG